MCIRDSCSCSSFPAGTVPRQPDSCAPELPCQVCHEPGDSGDTFLDGIPPLMATIRFLFQCIILKKILQYVPGDMEYMPDPVLFCIVDQDIVQHAADVLNYHRLKPVG